MVDDVEEQGEEEVEPKGKGLDLARLLQPLTTALGIFAGVLGALVLAPMITEYLNREPEPEPESEVVEIGDGEVIEVSELPELPPIFLPLNPPLVVNFEVDQVVRFLQLTIEVMARDQEVIDQVQLHMPVIRNNLLFLFGAQDYAEINTRAGKEQLRAQALEEIRAVLVKNTGQAGVEDVYFTSFVVQ